MTIKRADVDKRKIDFSDVRSGRRLSPVHPGEILRDELLTPMGISVYALSNAIQGPTLSNKRHRSRTSRHHSRYCDTSRPVFWHVARVLDQSTGTA